MDYLVKFLDINQDLMVKQNEFLRILGGWGVCVIKFESNLTKDICSEDHSDKKHK